MKGIVFTEFLDMVEEKFGYSMVDSLLLTTDLPSDGIYTSVGTYNHTEMVDLVINLSERSGITIPDLLRTFGKFLFKSFTKSYHHFMEKTPDAFSFLESIHNYIHVEVQKLYPDAELPHFDVEKPDDNTLIMTYTSVRKMADLAYGLMQGCTEYYKEDIEISQIPLNQDGSITKFILFRK